MARPDGIGAVGAEAAPVVLLTRVDTGFELYGRKWVGRIVCAVLVTGVLAALAVLVLTQTGVMKNTTFKELDVSVMKFTVTVSTKSLAATGAVVGMLVGGVLFGLEASRRCNQRAERGNQQLLVQQQQQQPPAPPAAVAAATALAPQPLPAPPPPSPVADAVVAAAVDAAAAAGQSPPLPVPPAAGAGDLSRSGDDEVGVHAFAAQHPNLVVTPVQANAAGQVG